jgi:hypothetical protein
VTSVVHAGTAPTNIRPATGWMHSARIDAVIALLWVPFSAAAALTYGSRVGLSVVVALTLLTSLVHQPLTLGLIYGDPAQFAVAKRVFTYFPFLLVGAILVGRTISLSLVGVIAGLWNAEHTLMQRYGIARIYARKAGESDAPRGAGERPMMITWLAFALFFGAADPRTPKLLSRIDLGATNESGVEVLQNLRPWAVALMVVAGAMVVATTLRWWRHERTLASGFGPKRRYLLSTALLIGLIMLNPIVGLMGYVGAHALEYFVIVHGALGRRYTGPAAEAGGLVGRVVRGRLKATGCVVTYVVLIGAVLVAIQFRMRADLASVVLLTVGGMHVFFDGFIWKLRRPVVARSVAVE